MSESKEMVLKSALESCGLLEQAEEVGENMFRLQWDSTTLVCIARGGALVAIAPMFESLPEKGQSTFFKKLLQLNTEFGGTASFAIHSDESVVLQSGRGNQNLTPTDLKLLLTTVGKFAGELRGQLAKDFYQ